MYTSLQAGFTSLVTDALLALSMTLLPNFPHSQWENVSWIPSSHALDVILGSKATEESSYLDEYFVLK
jgi:hypothetical protein